MNDKRTTTEPDCTLHAQQFSMIAAGRSQTLAGTVRLTASEIVSTYLLPELLR